MRTRLIHDGVEKTYVVVLDAGDEVVSSLQTVAKEHELTASHFTGIGACERVTVGFFDRERKDYQRIQFDEQVEVMSLIGNISRDTKNEPRVHAHIVIGKVDGTAHGGHLLEARVWPTMEIFLIESPASLVRKMKSEVGLALIDLAPDESR